MEFFLPNDEPIDVDMLALAMQDPDPDHVYLLNLQTGKVDISSDDAKTSGKEAEEGISVPIRRISSQEIYQSMRDFVDFVVLHEDAQSAEKLEAALSGDDPLQRFKDVLNHVGEGWEEIWQGWQDDSVVGPMKEWLASLPVEIFEEEPE